MEQKPDLGIKFESTDLVASALKFINTTASHIFLTGKAGTGKTTFLTNLANHTHKEYIVVAPTGIAALNAGGVTIHSQFLFPIGTFIPERSLPQHIQLAGNYFSQEILARKHPLNSARKQVLRSIDLLVIDEVSMLRADLLDAIDYRLKAVRGNFKQSFGGVQLLLIGDLFQLPPIVKREEENVLKPYYKSHWFYESRALKTDNFVYIELDKIYRQQDENFIALLNKLRNNHAEEEDLQFLNQFYRSDSEIKNLKEVITLTTHNVKADDLNNRALKELNTKPQFFEARISGDFPESMYPVLQKLELKEGAQIMFVKNDTESKKYFNGKLATVHRISNGEIEVKMSGSDDLYTLRKERWENKKYTIDATSRMLHEDVIGSFEQYPVKLAWAITVHKSQGLTFDKAIVDVGQAFADGQVYVALSRLRSLNGLILRTRIHPTVISTDKNITEFSLQNNRPDDLSERMYQGQRNFIKLILNDVFNFSDLISEINYIQKGKEHEESFNEASMRSALTKMSSELKAERENTEKFRRQIETLLADGNIELLLERIRKGSVYYLELQWKLLKILLVHMAETQKRKRVKAYLTQLNDLEQLLFRKISSIHKTVHLSESILRGKTNFDFVALNSDITHQRAKLLSEVQNEVGASVAAAVKAKSLKSKKEKKDGPNTYEITLSMLNSGMEVTQIAKERGLVLGTIEGHLSKAVGEGRLSIFKFMPEEDVATIEQTLISLPKELSSKDVYEKLKGRYSYGQIRAVLAHKGIKPMRKQDINQA